jgi:sister chromatid cohesion protein PDS5
MEDHLPAAASTMATFLRRSSLWIVNTSSIPILLEHISPSFTPASQFQPQSQAQAHAAIDHENARVADISYRLLMFIAKHCPMIFESHVGLLTKMVSDDQDEMSTDIALRALAGVTRVDEKAVPKDSYVHTVNSVGSVIDSCACPGHLLIKWSGTR